MQTKSLVRVVALAVLYLGSPDRARCATFAVTNTNDSGSGSLRQAILDANANENDLFFVDQIEFDIAGPGPHTIAPNSPLPTITEGVQITGASFGDTNGLSIQIDGINAGAGANGLTIETDSCTISGLAITRFGGAAIRLNSAFFNSITANLLGTDVTGTNAAGNGTGILLDNSLDNTIEVNVIAFNSGNGVEVASGEHNALSSNFIFSNGGLGIDLGSDGVTTNDVGDADSGANNLQNYPVLTSAESDGVNTVIQGSLNSTANTEFLLEFFSNTNCDPSGHGEGERSIGAIFQTTDGSGNLTIDTNFPISVSAGEFITATATPLDVDGVPTDTSEFSACVEVLASGNHAPLSENDHYEMVQNTTLNVDAAAGVLANDTDPDVGDSLTAIHLSGPLHASSFNLNGNGSFEYTPTPGFAGSDFFTYQANDGTSSSLEATAVIVIGAATPQGSNVTVNLATQVLGIEFNLTVTFSNVVQAGVTTIEPIDPAGLGQLPPGFDIFNDQVFDVKTTAIFTGPVTICFVLPGLDDPQLFELLRVLHEENGTWMDRTILPADFDTGTICAQVNSLSPFAIALLSNPAGDVNGDFLVTSADSLLINQVLVGLRAPDDPIFSSTGFLNGDINQDSQVTGSDSLLINQVLVGLRPYVVSQIAPASHDSAMPTPVTIFGVGFSTNDVPPVVTIGPPVNLDLTDVTVINRELITAVVPAGGGLGTGTVNVVSTPTNGVISFGRFINQ
jgi:hypothetical protein